jgi:membrane-bound toxin of toxin-antitoxin system
MQDSENPFLATLRLPVYHSQKLFMIVAFVHIICLILPWLSELSNYVKILLTSVCIVSFSIYFFRDILGKGEEQAKMLILSYEDNWQVVLKNDAAHHAELDHRLFVHPWLTIISLNFDNRRQTFIFTPEILDADQFRRLRVRLRFNTGG